MYQWRVLETFNDLQHKRPYLNGVKSMIRFWLVLIVRREDWAVCSWMDDNSAIIEAWWGRWIVKTVFPFEFLREFVSGKEERNNKKSFYSISMREKIGNDVVSEIFGTNTGLDVIWQLQTPKSMSVDVTVGDTPYFIHIYLKLIHSVPLHIIEMFQLPFTDMNPSLVNISNK